MMSSVTFSDIAERNRARMETLGIPVSPYTLEVSLLQVMSSVGELATLSCNGALDFSKFEREEVETLIGRLTVSLATLSELFEVSAEEAALHYLDEEERVASRFAAPIRAATEAGIEAEGGNVASQRPDQTGAVDATAGAQPTPPTATVAVATTSAPLTVDGFFEKVDQLAFLPREAYDTQDIRWVVPTESGELKDIISGGADRRVMYDDFPLFMRLLAPYRDARHSTTPEPVRPSTDGALSVPRRQVVENGASSQSAMNPGSGTQSQEPEVRTKVVGYSADRDAQMFSPTHFSGGLFSPMANAADIRTTADVRPPSMPMTTADPVSGPVVPQQAVNAPPPPRGADRPNSTSRTVSPISQLLFFDYVDKLRAGSLAPQQIARLHLTFAVPDKDNLLVPLLNGGESITVTAANVNEFLRLVDRSPVTLAAETAAPAPHQGAVAPSVLRRTSSLRKVEVQNRLANDRQDFSPSHFTYGLFAPSKPVSEVYVDYDEGEQMLPPFLRSAAAAKRREDQQRSQGAQFAPRPGAELGAKSAYKSACRRGDIATVQSMVEEVRKNPQVATIYGITYCVPSRLEAGASEVERRDGLYALYPNSQEIPVDPNDVNVFLTLVRQYFPGAA